MLLLAIDAATRFSGLAILDEDRVVAEYLLQSNLTHSQRLLPAIDLLLKDAGKRIQDVEALVVSRGPGSFTGLRIGMSLAKGMAQALDIPLVGISSLEHWAAALGQYTATEALLLPLLDAGRGEFYSAFYSLNGAELLCLQPEAARTVVELRQILAADAEHPVYLTGDVLPHRQGELQQSLGESVIILEEHLTLPRPTMLALLGMARLRRGENDPLFSLTPQYLRLSEAERKRLERELADMGVE